MFNVSLLLPLTETIVSIERAFLDIKSKQVFLSVNVVFQVVIF